MKIPGSAKHIQIDKIQSKTVAVVAAATFVTIFCLLSSKALLSQAAFQRRVLHARRLTINQINKNINNADALVTQYGVFEDASAENIIGGTNTTDANALPPNGDNARIILDALPSRYDYPALLSSVAGILNSHAMTNQSITGNDSSDTTISVSAANPQLVNIPLEVSGVSNYANAQAVIKDFERSIRPFDITKLELNGSDSNMTATLTMATYYQPAKSVTLENKEVR
ncbi:MAG TPA: hypothetical protein VLE51_02460 [Candidatus Saccharimonadales bacterium]|nr:hypothetical protein [Candidatus Saccharimonadales bacterium]